MSDRNGVYQSLVDEYEEDGFTYEDASKLAILNLKYQYDYEKVNLSEEEHKRMGTGGINWWEKDKNNLQSPLHQKL